MSGRTQGFFKQVGLYGPSLVCVVCNQTQNLSTGHGAWIFRCKASTAAALAHFLLTTRWYIPCAKILLLHHGTAGGEGAPA